MYSEDDLLPISGLQHLAFCERRWALVHIEQIWEENRFTAEGRVIHEKAHSGDIESRPHTLIRRAVPLHSFALGITGQADVIEFHPVTGGKAGITIDGRKGLWRPFPIEYKRRRDKAGSIAYQIQLCAQALCLEEMLRTPVPEGAVYDAETRHRYPVLFDSPLRTALASLAARMHRLYAERVTPAPIYKKACHRCSLFDRCLPQALQANPKVATYLALAGQQD